MPSRTAFEPADAGWNFDNSYTRLPESLFFRIDPVPVRDPRMAVFNLPLAKRLGLNPDALDSEAGAAVFSGNLTPRGALPIAQAYAGHQFGHFTMLGDGRAILLGEHVTPQGERFDIQLKGSGRTPFSRRGDGRAALGPMLREYIVSEAMHGLGIPTTRSLAVVATGEPVYRETTLPGAILTRVATSHIRAGTFEYLAARGAWEDLRILAEYTISRHFPGLEGAAAPFPALLEEVMQRQASLVARWQLAGFIHGVMNTDNMSLCGETMDYGPCAFMDAYDPATVFSSIDHEGRYSFGNQPHIAQWNLARFAQTLLLLLHGRRDEAVSLAQGALALFPETFQSRWLSGMRAKLGLYSQEPEDRSLAEDLLACMHRNRADYAGTFRGLAEGDSPKALPEALEGTPLYRDEGFLRWRGRWRDRLARQPHPWDEARGLMRSASPAVIPRNHRVEEALEAAGRGDYTVMHRLLEVLANPYEDPPPRAGHYRSPPPPSQPPYRTFCGT